MFQQTHCTCIITFFSTCTDETCRIKLELWTKTCRLQLILTVLPSKHRNTCLLFYILILTTLSKYVLTPSSYSTPDKSQECELPFLKCMILVKNKIIFRYLSHERTSLCMRVIYIWLPNKLVFLHKITYVFNVTQALCVFTVTKGQGEVLRCQEY